MQRGSSFLAYFVAVAAALLVGIPFVFGQQVKPGGQQVLNQGLGSAAVTPSDTQQFLAPTRAIFNGNATACNIAMKLVGDTAAVTWQNIQPGELLPVSALFVMNTNTTCSNIVAIW